jgi:DNA-directed RNA polymerase subunit RPC12/RpoP
MTNGVRVWAYTCLTCGALVHDESIHDAFHVRIGY